MAIHTIGGKPVPKLNIGDVVFFKKVTKMPDRRSQEIGFKGGHGFGVMLGMVPPFAKAPPESLLMLLMGQAGYVAFDDVMNFFGEEVGKECVKKFEEKYYPKMQNTPEGPKMVLPDYKKPKLINPDSAKKEFVEEFDKKTFAEEKETDL